MEAVGNLVAGIAALLGIAVVVVLLVARKAIARRQALVAYAAARGWTFEREQPLLVERFTGPPFGIGYGRRAFNVLYGTHEGRDLVSFDYQYVEKGADGKRHTRLFSVLGLNMGTPMLPLRVDPEGWLDRFVGRFTGDIDTESAEFNAAFQVSCPDRKFASDVLHPRMMEYLLQHRQLGWRFEQDSMLVIAAGQRTPQQIEATVAVMDGITDLVPEFVWLRLRGLG